MRETTKPAQRLGAYIPVTSANTPLGFHQDFARLGGYSAMGLDLEGRIQRGQHQIAMVWRADGMSPGGAMSLDRRLYLNPKSSDPIERAAADESALVEMLKRIKNALDKNAGGNTLGELTAYLGNLEESGPGETPLSERSSAERTAIVKRILHPLRVAGVDVVAIDASGLKGVSSIEREVADLILSEGFKRVGYEGYADPQIPSSVRAWTTDSRFMGILMAYWSYDWSVNPSMYPSIDATAGPLSFIKCGHPSKRGWNETPAQAEQFIRKMLSQGFRIYDDIYSGKAPVNLASMGL